MLIKPVDVEQLQALLQRFPGTRPAAHEQPSALEDTSAAVKPLAVTDLALGRKLAGGNAVRARRQLIALIESLGQSEREMYQARRQGDEKALLDAVHCLHGASRYCGAPELALRVESLETQLRTRGMDHADSLLEGLYQAMARLHAAKPQLVSV